MLSKKSSKNSSLSKNSSPCLWYWNSNTKARAEFYHKFLMTLGYMGGNYSQFPLSFQNLTNVTSAWFFFYTNDYIFLLCFILINNCFFHNQMKRLLLLNNISFECVVSMQHFLINILFIAPHYNFLLCLTEKTIMNFPSNETLLLSAKAICLPTAGMCVSLAFRGTRPAVFYGDLEEFMYITHKVCHIHMEINCSPK